MLFFIEDGMPEKMFVPDQNLPGQEPINAFTLLWLFLLILL